MRTEGATRTERNEILVFVISKVKVIDENGCWFKSKTASKNNYQTCTWKSITKPIHIWSAIAFLDHNFGSEWLVCHKCDVKACFNPKHLFLGTESQNNLDAVYKGRNLFGRDVKYIAKKLGEKLCP